MQFIHPGFVKTATSSLQVQVFSNHPDIHYLGMPAKSTDMTWAIRHICRADSVYYERDRVREIFSAALESAPDGKSVILSHENFALYESKDKGMLAQRLRELIPDAKVFFTLRRQEEILASWYLQKLAKYIRGNNFISFDRWLKLKLKARHRSILDDLNFYPIIDFYAGLFGRENIRIFLFEELREDSGRFASDMSSFLDVDTAQFEKLLKMDRQNPTISQDYIEFWHRWGPWLPYRLAQKLALRMDNSKGRPAKIDIGEQSRALVRTLCAEGNRQLEETYNLPLRKFGYTMSDAG
ncbi:hypothetical protein DFR30_2369 [Thiogranum longum]|uniref:Sulfotransferase domain-containing protein n=1 Tax=Thiogranum longum TaxID=1537524 RepID=A0A4R1HFG2_9GAMM|nr:hypothetical protein [Thiogranum longum]TCK19075.1 hypothetical protein DFR30_2369 [Thiogranum longum]